MAINITEVCSYENYGRCLRLDNGETEALVTLDLGPRIIRYGFIGGENVFWNDLERVACNSGEDIKKYYGGNKAWYLYGGHRLWASPETSPETYYPDNDPVEYEAVGSRLVFTPKPQTENGLQMSVAVTMNPDGSLALEHHIKNIGTVAKKFAIWALSVLARGGLEIVPQNTDATGYLQNRVLSVWPYSDMTDGRVYFGKKYITLLQKPDAQTPFKIGTDNKNGFALYLLKETALIKKYTHFTGEEYPDFGVSFETYTNANFLEMETLGVYKTVQPGENTVHRETLELKIFNRVVNPRDEEDIEKAVRELL
ncbi:MAG: hypothetical protein LBQ68_09495 [Clostridiales bacterium]|jgi:hypothetical protein|nr:hypothetical protein [Clostridiales bacterium]